MKRWAERAELARTSLVRWLGLGTSKFYQWQDRYGLAAGNEELHRRLTARGVAHEFALPPGDHGYEYVLSVLDKGLRFLGSALKAR